MAGDKLVLWAGELVKLVDQEDGSFLFGVAPGGDAVRVRATLTRPGDTSAYAAGDQIADSTSAPTVITFEGVARKAGGGFILTDAVCSDSFNQATKPNLRLYLFAGTAAPTPNNDNSPWLPSDADYANAFASIEFSSWEVGGTTVGGAGNCKSFVRNIGITGDCGAAVYDIWGLAVDRGGYTPGSAETWTFELGVVRL